MVLKGIVTGDKLGWGRQGKWGKRIECRSIKMGGVKWKKKCGVTQEGHRKDNRNKKCVAAFLKFDPLNAENR